MAKDKVSRIDVMRKMQVGEAIFVNQLLQDGATASDARDTCRKMARAICSSTNILKSSGMKFQTCTGTTVLSTTNPRMVCVMVVERIA